MTWLPHSGLLKSGKLPLLVAPEPCKHATLLLQGDLSCVVVCKVEKCNSIHGVVDVYALLSCADHKTAATWSGYRLNNAVVYACQADGQT